MANAAARETAADFSWHEADQQFDIQQPHSEFSPAADLHEYFQLFARKVSTAKSSTIFGIPSFF